LPDDLKNLWKELSTNPLQRSPDQLRNEMETLRKRLSRRFVLGVGALLIMMTSWPVFFFLVPTNLLQRIGAALTVLGVGYLLVQVKMRAVRTMRSQTGLGETDCTEFYRGELERQRDFHRGQWFWSRLMIFLPGPIIWFWGLAQAYPEFAIFIGLAFASLLILVVIAVPLNLKAARNYQRRIDALDAAHAHGGEAQKKD